MTAAPHPAGWDAAIALLGAGRLDEAAVALGGIVRADPGHAPAWNNLGIALRRLRRFNLAEAALRRGLALPEGDTEGAWSNLGNVLRDQGRFDEAEAAFAAAIRAGGSAGTRYNAALLLRDRGRLDEALAMIAPAVAADPANPRYAWDLALMLLQAGDWGRGFAAYEARWRLPGVARPASEQPWWQGEPLAGRTLLLVGEQGMGDAIQFARFIPQIRRDGGRIILAVRKPLLRLMQAAPALADVAVVEATAELPAHDLLLPLMSLPRVLGATPETLPPPLGFGVGDSARAAASARFSPRAGRRRVGLVWAGSAGHRNDRNRSARFESFLPLLADPGLDVQSLQIGPRAADAAAAAHAGLIGDLAPAIDDFLDTAAFLLTIDVLVSVDTGIVHLAGSLGVPTVVVVPEACDWRWGIAASDTPWYPSLGLIRQPRQGDWAAAMDRLAATLATMTV